MEPRQESPQEPQQIVEFARGHTLAMGGLIAGVLIALLVPLIVLKYGERLTDKMQLTVIILAVSLGGAVALTAAFFGTVMPTAVRPDHRELEARSDVSNPPQ
jgi:hypothetical protein